MQNEEVPHDSVEGAIVESKVVSIPAAEVEPWMQPRRERDHRWSDVHANDGRSAVRPFGRHVPRAAGEIEHPRPCPNGGSIKERPDEPAGNAAEEVVILRRLLFPACRFEGVERVRVNRLILHDTTLRPPQHADKARACAAVYCRLSLRPLGERWTPDGCCALLRFAASRALPHGAPALGERGDVGRVSDAVGPRAVLCVGA